MSNESAVKEKLERLEKIASRLNRICENIGSLAADVKEELEFCIDSMDSLDNMAEELGDVISDVDNMIEKAETTE